MLATLKRVPKRSCVISQDPEGKHHKTLPRFRKTLERSGKDFQRCKRYFDVSRTRPLELRLLGKLFSDISSRAFSLCSILTADHPCSNEVLEKLSTLEDRFSISLKISLRPNSASRKRLEILFSILFEISSKSRFHSWVFS